MARQLFTMAAILAAILITSANVVDYGRTNFPESKAIKESGDAELNVVLRQPNDLWTCCLDDEDFCMKHTGVKKDVVVEGKNESRWDYPFVVETTRTSCGKDFSFKVENRSEGYELSNSTKIFVRFQPNVPVIKRAQYDLRTNCLVVVLKPEDTGKCQLRYSVHYDWDRGHRVTGEFVGTKTELQNVEMKSCWNERMYERDARPKITVEASVKWSAMEYNNRLYKGNWSSVTFEEFGDQVTVPVTTYESEDPTICPELCSRCPSNSLCNVSADKDVTCTCKGGFYKGANDTCVLIRSAFSSKFVLNQTFAAALKDKDSKEFKEFASEFREGLLKNLTVEGVRDIIVRDLKQGVVEYHIVMDEDVEYNKTSVLRDLWEVIYRRNMSGLRVNRSFVPEVEAFNKCQYDVTNDCHRHANCTQKGDKYECNCNDGFIGNGEKCKDAVTGKQFLGLNMTRSDLENGTYKIFNKKWGGPLFGGDEGAGNETVRTWVEPRRNYENDGEEMWRIQKLFDGSYMLYNKRWMDPLYSGDASDGGDHWTWVKRAEDYDASVWYIQRQSDGFYKLFNKKWGGPLFCGDATSSEGNHWVWVEPRHKYENNGNERWEFERIGNLTFSG